VIEWKRTKGSRGHLSRRVVSAVRIDLRAERVLVIIEEITKVGPRPPGAQADLRRNRPRDEKNQEATRRDRRLGGRGRRPLIEAERKVSQAGADLAEEGRCARFEQLRIVLNPLVSLL